MKKLDDPAYSGWFLKFDKSKSKYHVPACAAENQSKCSIFYHDQEQTPEVSGLCTDGVCDCGSQPCGEYLWNHRNDTHIAIDRAQYTPGLLYEFLAISLIFF